MDEHGLKRLLLHLLHAGEYHSCDPEEDDVVARDHDGGGVPVVKLRGLVRPAESAEGPKCGRKPSVKHVLLLVDRSAAAVSALLRIGAGDGDLAAVVAVPCGDPVSPPELTGNAPVVDVLHPVHIDLGEAFGDELYPSVLNDVYRRLRQRLHLYKPLGAGERLNDGAAAVAAADIVTVRLDLHEVALLLKVRNDRLSRLVAVHAVILAAVYDLGVLVYHEYLLKTVAKSDLVVVGVMAGGHLNGAGAEAQLNVFVRNDGEPSSHERQYRILADKLRVALVVGMNGNAGVAEHGLGAGRCDYQIAVGVLKRVADVPKAAGHILILDLRIGKCGTALGTPVYYAVALVDKSLLVQLAEGLTDALCSLLIHGENASVPVAGCAQHLLLLYYPAAVLVLPIPNTLKEFLTSEIVAGKSLLLAKLLLDLYLRCDARMVGTRHPQCRIALHPLVAGQDVLKRTVESVSHVELTGHVRRGHDDRKGLLVLRYDSLKISALLPHGIYLLFHRTRIVNFRQFFHSYSSCPYFYKR